MTPSTWPCAACSTICTRRTRSPPPGSSPRSAGSSQASSRRPRSAGARGGSPILGYPSLEEALSWFARPPRAPAATPGPSARPPGFFLATLATTSLLDRAFAALEPEERDAVERQIVSAANAVIVADAVDPADLDAVRAAFEAARAYLELGLEKLGGADERRAVEELAATPVKRIFQEGFGRVLELRWRAERILAAAGGAERFRSPLAEMLAALARRRPRYFPGIEAPREEWGTPMAAAFEPRHFRSSGDLARTAAALDEAEAKRGARTLGSRAAAHGASMNVASRAHTSACSICSSESTPPSRRSRTSLRMFVSSR